jgi:hypothetical protein
VPAGAVERAPVLTSTEKLVAPSNICLTDHAEMPGIRWEQSESSATDLPTKSGLPGLEGFVKLTDVGFEDRAGHQTRTLP